MSLEVKNLTKKYGEKTVVDGLSFTLENPGVYALLGTNGAGKTTSIRMILGMLACDGGQVLWQGKAHGRHAYECGLSGGGEGIVSQI